MRTALSRTLAAFLILLPATPATAAASPDPVTRWAERHAAPPIGPRLRDTVGAAEIVGLGEPAHSLAEVFTLKADAVRYLVTELGFRTVAWEEDWSLGTQLNDYVLGRRDDRDALVGRMSRVWRTRETAGLLSWLRAYNRTHRDQVQFTGVEYYATRPLSYDAVERYVRHHAPASLPAVERLVARIKPWTDDMGRYQRWFEDVPDKERHARHARTLHDLVAALPHRPGDRAHALALHHATQIRSYYTAFTLPQNFAHRDARAAENLRWWHRYSGDKIAYWAASAHTADVPDLRVSTPDGTIGWPTAGSHLRTWYADRYRSLGFTVDHGTMGGPVDLPPPLPSWFEAPLADVRRAQFLLDLRRPAPPEVRAWLHGPMVTRGIPELGHESEMTGGTPAGWFDAIVHRQVVTPTTPLPAPLMLTR